MTEAQIHFHYELEGFRLDNSPKYINWFLDVAQQEGKELSILNYIFCSDEYLLKINIDYLGHNYYTDILSFPLKEDPIEGDIFISVDRVKDNAQTYETSFDEELKRVMIHGLLHFFGYDDHEEEDIKVMREKEAFYLERFITL